MGIIFISHSSKDDKEVERLMKWLRKEKHPPIFLDQDPEVGLEGGKNWEKELYQKLKECQLVIVLCSKNSMASKWCFAEITIAKSEGKKVLPLIIKPIPNEIPSILKEIQAIDLSSDRRVAYKKLRRVLSNYDVDDRPEFQWDGRPPYPGLFSYQKEDEPFFFARSNDIQACQDILRSLQVKGKERFLMLLGASGCGKSSFMRAGLIPYLQRDEKNWLIVEPFRPEGDPFLRFAVALSSTFVRYDVKYAWKTILPKIPLKTDGSIQENSDWFFLFTELKASAMQLDATVLIFIDQFEELFGQKLTEKATKFFQMLSSTLSHPECPIVIVSTMRSDFLAHFQQHPELEKIEVKTFFVKQLSIENFAEIIQKPADLVGLSIEPRLLKELIADSGGKDALPLLAFTLREIWDKYRVDNQFTFDAYRERLGGISGAVARVAADVIATEKLSDELNADLHKSFRMMVQINEEGQYVRQPVLWSNLPEKCHTILENLISARLLVSRDTGAKREIEVAHEALFRQWALLKDWLDEDRGFFLWRRRLSRAMSEWKLQHLDQSALLSGAQLAEALRWFTENETALTDNEKTFISQSKSFSQSLELAQRSQRLYDRLDADNRKGLVLAIESLKRFPTFEGDQALRRGLRLHHGSIENENAAVQQSEVKHPKHQDLKTTDAMQTALRLRHESGIEFVSFSQDGRWIGTAGHDGRAIVWDSKQGAEIGHIPHEGAAKSIAFSPLGRLVATASSDYTVHVTDIVANKEVAFYSYSAPSETVAFSPDGRWLVSAGWDNTVRLVETENFTEQARMEHDDWVKTINFSPDSEKLISASADGTARIWRIPQGTEFARITHNGQVNTSIWGITNTKLAATGSDDRTVCIWSLEDRKEITRLVHNGAVHRLCFSPDGTRLLAAGSSQYAVVWDVLTNKELARLNHDGPVNAIDYSNDGQYLATGSFDCTAKVWSAEAFREIALLTHNCPISRVAFSPENRLVATVCWQDRYARMWFFKPEDLIQQACTVVKKNLDRQEWQAIFGSEPYRPTCS